MAKRSRLSSERKALEGRSERPAMGHGQSRTGSGYDFRGAPGCGTALVSSLEQSYLVLVERSL